MILRTPPLLLALLVAPGCAEGPQERLPIPGDRYALVSEEVVSNTCAEDSPPFRLQQTYYLDLHDVNDGEYLITRLFDQRNNNLLNRGRRVPAAEPWDYKYSSQEGVGWPPDESWTEDDWAWVIQVIDTEFEWEDPPITKPRARVAWVLDVDGDRITMELVFDLPECRLWNSCLPWGGSPCTQHIRKVFEFERELPDYAPDLVPRDEE